LPFKPVTVTIGIPVFNCETWVANAIQSSLEQTWPDKEIIVVDDGSTDRSAEICKSFGNRIRFVQQPNRGGNAARNQIWKLSSGDWIQFLDADDYLKPDKIRAQLEACADPAGADVLCSSTICETWKDGHVVDQTVVPIENGCDWIAHWLTWSMPQTGGCLWRKQALEAIGGWNEQFRYNQDYELYFRALQKELRIRVVGRPLSVYRIWSEDTVCRSDKEAVLLGRTALIHCFLHWLRREGKWAPLYQRLAGRTCFETARTLANKDLTLATRYYHERKREGLMQPEGNAAPWKYRVALRCFGFSAAESLARIVRTRPMRPVNFPGRSFIG
jgi:GT2 family glycosyltransferase